MTKAKALTRLSRYHHDEVGLITDVSKLTVNFYVYLLYIVVRIVEMHPGSDIVEVAFHLETVFLRVF